MSLRTDVKNAGEGAIEQLAARFHDLPRPLLAAIGAGDMAVERLASLRESLGDSLPGSSTASGDVKTFAAELPAKAQQIAADVASSIEEFASQAPAKAQKLIAELPGKMNEIAESLSPENVKGTVEAYTQLVGMIYGNLAERGEKAVAKTRSTGGVTVIEAAAAAPRARRTAAPAARKSATRRTAKATPGIASGAAGTAAKKSGAKSSPRTVVKAGAKTGAAKVGAAKTGAAKAGAAKTGAGKAHAPRKAVPAAKA